MGPTTGQPERRRRGVDANVLVYAHVRSAPEHEQVFHFLSGQLNDEATVLVVTPSVLAEFIRVITDGRRYPSPAAMSAAVALAFEYTESANVECLPVDEPAFRLSLELLTRYRLGRRRVADTMFAAVLLLNEVDELITCDPDDFAIFEGLSVVDPRV